MMISWSDVKTAVLAKAPGASAALDVVEQYWGDGKLTEELATQFIQAWTRGDYVAAKKLLYASMDANALISADNAANTELKEAVETETKVYNFVADLEGAVLKAALGAALAAVGL